MHPFAQVARNIRKAEREIPLQEKRPSTLPVETRSPEPLASTTTAANDFTFDLAALDNVNLEDFARGRTVLTIRSEILEDVFLLVPDSYVKRPGDPVAYTVKEAEVLLSLPGDLMKAAHSLKKTIGGRILTEEEIKKEGL